MKRPEEGSSTAPERVTRAAWGQRLAACAARDARHRHAAAAASLHQERGRGEGGEEPVGGRVRKERKYFRKVRSEGPWSVAKGGHPPLGSAKRG